MKSPKEIFILIWLPISLLLNVVSLIALQKDLIPALIAWSEFFVDLITSFSTFRDTVFYPLHSVLIALFDISIPVWIKNYLIFSMLFFSTIVATLKKLEDQISIDELKNPGLLLFEFAFAPFLVFFNLFGAHKIYGRLSLMYMVVILVIYAVFVLINRIIY